MYLCFQLLFWHAKPEFCSCSACYFSNVYWCPRNETLRRAPGQGVFKAEEWCSAFRPVLWVLQRDVSLLNAIPMSLFIFMLTLLLLEHLDCVTTASRWCFEGIVPYLCPKSPRSSTHWLKRDWPRNEKISLLGAVCFLIYLIYSQHIWLIATIALYWAPTQSCYVSGRFRQSINTLICLINRRGIFVEIATRWVRHC